MRAREIHELRRTQRYMIQGLEHTFLFDDDHIRSIACNDEIDQEILDVLYMAVHRERCHAMWLQNWPSTKSILGT